MNVPFPDRRAHQVLALAGFLLAAWPCAAATFTVNTTVDAVDTVPGDGFCGTAAAACSLRAAVEEAGALLGPDFIHLPAGSYPLTLGQLSVSSSCPECSLTLTGAGPATTAIDAAGRNRLLNVGGTDLTIP